MATRANRVYAPNPIMSAPPGIYGERITGDGSMAGSFVVYAVKPGRIVGYQSEVWKDADIAACDGEGESRLDLFPLVLRAIREARRNG